MIRRILIVPAALALAACDPGGTGPSLEGGTFRAVLQSPNGAEGAALLEMEGTGITDFTAPAGELLGTSQGTPRRMVFLKEPAGTIEFQVTVEPGNELPTVRVLEVVDGADVPRASLNGYRVNFSRVEGS